MSTLEKPNQDSKHESGLRLIGVDVAGVDSNEGQTARVRLGDNDLATGMFE